MKHLLRRGGLALLLFPLALVFGLGARSESLPLPPPGNYTYTVEVEGRGKVGEMKVSFEQNATGRIMRVARRIQVKMLGITVYRNTSDLSQTVKDGRLSALTRISDEDGKKSRLDVARSGDKLEVSDGKTTWTVAADLLPASPWSPQVLTPNELLDTDSGKAVPVSTEAKGTEEVTVGGKSLTGQRYSQSGTLARDLWFDGEGRLLRMILLREGNKVTTTLQRIP